MDPMPYSCEAHTNDRLSHNTTTTIHGEQHQKENLQVMQLDDGKEEEKLALTLSDDDMKQIASLERGHRYFRPDDWWPEMAMAVFD